MTWPQKIPAPSRDQLAQLRHTWPRRRGWFWDATSSMTLDTNFALHSRFSSVQDCHVEGRSASKSAAASCDVTPGHVTSCHNTGGSCHAMSYHTPTERRRVLTARPVFERIEAHRRLPCMGLSGSKSSKLIHVNFNFPQSLRRILPDESLCARVQTSC